MSKSETLAAAVQVSVVRGLMAGRLPDFVDQQSPDYQLYLTTVGGVAREVAPLAGPEPADGRPETVTERWELAQWAVALGTAASIEGSLFPEQQGIGNQSQAQLLTTRYEAVLTQLRGHIEGDSTDGDTDGIPAPVGSFPAPAAYPDPVLRYQTNTPGYDTTGGRFGGPW